MDDEAGQFHEDGLYDEALGHLEAKHALESATRIGAAIEIDLQDRGPLYLYVMARRKAAMGAMKSLIEIDPSNGIEIAAAQAAVREYVMACGWIRAQLDAAGQADEMIKEAYGNGEETHGGTGSVYDDGY